MYKIGVDIGGTKTSFGLFKDGFLLKKVTIQSPKNKKDEMIEKISAIISEISLGIPRNQINGVGIGIPGELNRITGIVYFMPNLPIWKNIPIKKLLEKKLKLRVEIENDANCSALAEARLRRIKNLIYLGIGTGLGGGIIMDGKIYHGKETAGELGHMIINFNGPKCSCGSNGCLESYVSARGAATIAKRVCRQKMTSLEIYTKAAAGDKKAIECYNEFGKYLGIGISNISNIFDPKKIIIGGGLSNASRFFLNSALKEMKSRTLMKNLPKVEISNLKDSGIIGASLLID
ncbi:MAG: ROK family protein [Nanoarchaeota archaeon]